VKDFIAQYLAVYEPSTPSWENVTDISNYLNLSESTSLTAEEYYEAQKINKKYSSEIIEGTFTIIRHARTAAQ
jgi:prenylcysteine oxidase / farnesylcysteine lyase